MGAQFDIMLAFVLPTCYTISAHKAQNKRGLQMQKVVKYCKEMNPRVAGAWIYPDGHDPAKEEGWYWTYDSSVLNAHYGPYNTKDEAERAAARRS